MNRTREGREHGAVFWTCFAVGGSIMAWGGRLFLDATPDLARRANFTAFLVGAALVHDLVFVPLLALVGVVVVRVAPRGARAAIQAGLMASGVILLVAAAPLRDTAARAGNPTIQPLDYGTATLTALAVVWVAVALAALAIRLRPDRPT